MTTQLESARPVKTFAEPSGRLQETSPSVALPSSSGEGKADKRTSPISSELNEAAEQNPPLPPLEPSARLHQPPPRRWLPPSSPPPPRPSSSTALPSAEAALAGRSLPPPPAAAPHPLSVCAPPSSANLPRCSRNPTGCSSVSSRSQRELFELQKSAGGVLLPKSAVKFERYLMGEILSVGADVNEVEAGKKVLFSDINAYEVDLGTEEKHCFCRESDLLAVVA